MGSFLFDIAVKNVISFIAYSYYSFNTVKYLVSYKVLKNYDNHNG